jgi:UrcA family protein
MNVSSRLLRTAVLATVLLPIAALAQPPGPRPLDRMVVTEAPVPGATSRAVVVGFADLDLARPAGNAALYLRLHTAARRVCAPMQGRVPTERRDAQRCYANALDHAVATLDLPLLQAEHLARGGRGETSGRIVAQRAD